MDGRRLRGETLDVLGVSSVRIVEVFGFEPVDITVTAERVDLMLRDEDGHLFHLEEQRHLQMADLYRFAAYHFLAARQWGPDVTDVILASGEVMAGRKALETKSGTYSPLVIDFTQRDGARRLQEIRTAVQAGTFTQWLELVFVPLYGHTVGMARAAFVAQVVRFERELYQRNLISKRLIAATLIMSNKFVDRDLLDVLWEEVKMLDILEFAQEKGMEKGMEKGLEKGMEKGLETGMEKGKALGMVAAMQDLLLDMVMELYGIGASVVAKQIRLLTDPDVLKELHRRAIKCRDLHEFETLLQQLRRC